KVSIIEAGNLRSRPLLILIVSLVVLLQLGPPEVELRLRPSRILTCSMPVPEASVHEDDLTPAREDHVGIARQVPCVQPVAITHPVHKSPDQHLRLCVLPSNQTHPPAALGGRQGVHDRISHHCTTALATRTLFTPGIAPGGGKTNSRSRGPTARLVRASGMSPLYPVARVFCLNFRRVFGEPPVVY